MVCEHLMVGMRDAVHFALPGEWGKSDRYALMVGARRMVGERVTIGVRLMV